LVKKNKIKKNKYRKPDAKKQRAKSASQFAGKTLRGFTYIGSFLLIMIFCIFCYDVLTQTHYFDINHIEITGNERLSTKEIKYQGNLDKGMNILGINLKHVRQKLIAHPWVSDAEVTRVLPHKISISISEEKPLALISFDKPYIINRNGLIFKELDKRDEAENLNSLPIINGLTLSDFQDFNQTKNSYLTSALDIIRMGEHSDLVPIRKVSKVHVDKDLGITLTLMDLLKIQNNRNTKFSILKIRLGFGNYSLKYSRLNKVLYKLTTLNNNDDKNYQKIDLIDLSNTGRVIVKVSEA